MSLRGLIGPIWPNELPRYCHVLDDDCRLFSLGTSENGVTDLLGAKSWAEVAGPFSDGWQPDYLGLVTQYRSLPGWVWECPLPIVAWAGDWNWLWHGYRRLAPWCDRIFTDTAGVEAFRHAGFDQARPAILYGASPADATLLTENADETIRDIDLLFVGNFNAQVQPDRLAWLERVARLGARWNVVFETGVFGDDYYRLLRRSRIVFNRAVRGEWNHRVFEAMAGGALLFQERENRETPVHLSDRLECVYYGTDDLESLLTYYLENEEERQRIAAAGRAKMSAFTVAELWRKQQEILTAEWPAIQESAQRRTAGDAPYQLKTRLWFELSSANGKDSSLMSAFRLEVEQQPRNADLWNSLGLALAVNNEPLSSLAEAFQRAWQADPRHVVAGLNLAETLLRMNLRHEAAEQAERTLAVLDREAVAEAIPAVYRDSGRFPVTFDAFRVGWEQAAWQRANDPSSEIVAKSALVRGRLHAILGEVREATSNETALSHFFEAHASQPNSLSSDIALGFALARRQQFRTARRYLERALETNPFDREVARALFECLRQLGEPATLTKLIDTRRLLHKAGPKLVSAEPWFEPVAPSPRKVEPSSPFRLVWEGAQEALHSLALVNRSIVAGLLRKGHDVQLLQRNPYEPKSTGFPLADELRNRLNANESALRGAVDVHVMHQWPPRFEKPKAGRWVMMQPWEFGSIPAEWIGPLRHAVDELWVPSRWVRECFVNDGVPPEKVHVIPNGVVMPTGEITPHPLKTKKAFRFLFVGGTIHRKGFDLLLKAFSQVFSDRDDVCLVVKDMGVGTFYREQTAEAMINRARSQPNAPEIEYLQDELNDTQMSQLYAACHCLAHPYRGEGFGMPIAEAMAHGLAVIVTGYGPSLDYCDESRAYLLPYRLVNQSDTMAGGLKTVRSPWLAEPDQDALRLTLRRVVVHAEERAVKGMAAKAYVRENLTWEHSVAAIESRLFALTSMPEATISTFPSIATAPSRRARVSLCMIVKNEEHNLPACLASVRDLVDEMIIVDTGSSDNTVAIAHEHGAKVHFFPWQDSFALARNESIRHATGDWIFWMDADDRIDAANQAKLREVFQTLPEQNFGFVMKCLCMPDPETGTATVVDHVRLFRNHPEIRWKYRIHEQILPSIRKLGGDVRWAGVTIQHVGYQDASVRKKKLARDLALLVKEDADNPNDPFTLFNLASLYQEQREIQKTLDCLRLSLQLSNPTDSIVRKLYAMMAQCQRQSGQPEAALTTCEEGRRHYPLDAELLFQESLVRQDLGDLPGAEQSLVQLISTKEGNHFASVDTGLRGHKARHNLAVLCMKQHRPAEAESHWRAAIEDAPNFVPAHVGLADLLLSATDRVTDFQATLTNLEATGKAPIDVLLFRSRFHLKKQEFGIARRLAHDAIALAPTALGPRLVMSHVLLQEGQDWQAAARALRDVLALDPNHAEALQNLAVLEKKLSNPSG